MKAHLHISKIGLLVRGFTAVFIIGLAIKLFSVMLGSHNEFADKLGTIGLYIFIAGAAGLMLIMIFHAIIGQGKDWTDMDK
ncbi:hypothetical protein [Solitalea koreensis]|uniref:Uncharacterized protein n=1 Tax=Solitalea koreensis TaxID=543615 RepID=A0A521DA53_9SPHI|nr:hypothetical protein [Solitalea koreensis]SMO68482.1 hypothetical protein SAMN06265350_106103 [Solitalea koreensis]